MRAIRPKQSAGWAVLALAFLLPTGAQAQIAWNSPLLVSANSPAGFSFLLAEMDPAERLAGMVAWRKETAPGSIGFRAGLGEGPDGDIAGLGAFDYSGWIHQSSTEFPLDVAWVTGAGLGVGDYVFLSAPIGASFAYEVTASDIWFNPYITPLVVFDWLIGAPSGADDFDLGLAVDIGADVAFAESWAVRFGATVGDRRGLAVGIHVPGVQLGG